MTLHHQHVCRVHLVFFNSSRDGIKPWLDDSPEPKWHLNNSVEHIRSYSYFALHLEATLPVTHTQTDRLGLTWIPKKQGDTRSECVWASSPFLLPLVFLANENLKITCSPLKIWVRAPMRSQFNTKASSSALWVFPPVVELRQGAWVCVLLDAYSCSFFFFFFYRCRWIVVQSNNSFLFLSVNMHIHFVLWAGARSSCSWASWRHWMTARFTLTVARRRGCWWREALEDSVVSSSRLSCSIVCGQTHRADSPQCTVCPPAAD